MELDETLTRIEDEGWRALASEHGAEFYDGILTEDAIMVLPVGVMTRSECIDAFKHSPPWSRYTMEDVKVLPIADGSAGIVTYRVHAEREGMEYRSLMSSTYVRRGDSWKLAFHQQTPLPPEEV